MGASLFYFRIVAENRVNLAPDIYRVYDDFFRSLLQTNVMPLETHT